MCLNLPDFLALLVVLVFLSTGMMAAIIISVYERREDD